MTIHITSPSATQNIINNRIAQRRLNLKEDLEYWKKLATQPCNSVNKQSKDKKSITIGDKLTNNIVRLTGGSEEQVLLTDIADLAKQLVLAPEIIQLNYCRDPTRQSDAEDIQLETLRYYLPTPTCTVSKITCGTLTLVNGVFSNSTQDIKRLGSIDFKVNNNIFIYAKYISVAGGGQSNQVSKCIDFISEAKQYINQNNDNNIFIAMLDGNEGEKQSHAINKMCLDFPDKLYAGNSERVINFISQHV
jgi:hypothetical protein